MTDSRIRILHLSASEFIGGPEKQILHHAADVNSPKCEMIVGSFRNGAKSPDILLRAKELGLRTIELPPGRFHPKPIFELARFLREEAISIVCTHTYKANVSGYLATLMTGTPQVGFVRGWLAETWKVRQYERLDRMALARMSWVACVSKPQADYLKVRRGTRREPFVIPNAALLLSKLENEPGRKVDLRRTLGLPEGALVVGAIGRFSIEKGHRYLLEAMRIVVGKHPEAHLVLLGEGRERRNLEDLADQLRLRHSITFADFQKNVSPWIRSCDVIANPSLTEGIPNVVLEAMALCTPVVATAVGGVPDLIDDGRTGLLVRSQDVEGLSKGILRVLEHPAEAAVMARRGMEKVTTEFSPQNQRELLLAMYEEVLSAGPGSAKGGGGLETLKRHSSVAAAAGVDSMIPQESSRPFISVVIPVRNEENHIEAVLKRLEAQNYPKNRMEILVADGNSTDRTGEIVDGFAQASEIRVRRLSNPAQLSSAGRNVGIKNASGDVVAFIDGHCEIPGDDLLTSIADLFSRTNADCLCRPQPLTTQGNTAFQEVVAHVRSTSLGHGADSTIYDTGHEREVNPSSAGAIYLKRVFDRVGIYDESFDACEDVEFNYRVFCAGMKSILSPRLTVHYHPRTSVGTLWRQMSRYGRGRCRLIRKHPDAFTFAQIVPAGLWMWVIGGGIVAAISNRFAMVYLASWALYLCMIMAFSLRLAVKHSFAHLLLSPLVYLTVHFGLGSGFLSELVTPSRLVSDRKSRPAVVVP